MCIVFLISVSLTSILLVKMPYVGAEDGAIQTEAARFQGSLVFDKNGVPYYNYSHTGNFSIGVQGSPHAVSTYALDLYKKYLNNSNQSARTYFINNVNWLTNTAMLKNDASISVYEFSFPWQIGNNTIGKPWRSAMANSEALSPLVKAYQITGNNTYLDTAKRLLNSFYVDTKEGGLTYKSPNSGWWYEQYASKNSTKEPRVLNGMIYTLLGINEYYKDTNDSSAKFLFDQGILALKNDLSKYENNGTLLYDRSGVPANSFYRSNYLVLLDKLYQLTADQVFKTFHDKWEKNIVSNSQAQPN